MKMAGVALLVVAISGCATGDKVYSDLQTDDQKIAYAVGYQTSLVMRDAVTQQGLHSNLGELFLGMRDGVEKPDSELQLSKEQIQYYTQMQSQRLTEKAEAERAQLEAEAERVQREFFEEELKREIVQKTDSGILYEVQKRGQGDFPEVNGTVKVHYEGWLLDGTRFDGSDPESEPARVSLSRAVSGWKEILPMMREGDRWRVLIPYDLAYGEAGMDNLIPPFSGLIFEIELVEAL